MIFKMSRRSRLEQERSRSRSPVGHRSRSASMSDVSDINLSTGRIVIRGLPKDYDWIKVKELFLMEVGFSGFLEVVDNGTAVMVFKSLPGAVKAIKAMDGYKLEDNILSVTEESEVDRMELKSKQQRMSDKYSDRRSGGRSNDMARKERHQRITKYLNTSADASRYMTPEVLEYLGIDGPLTNQVFVSHLDYSVNWQKLKDVFRLAGNVLNAEVKENPDGTPRGLAIITYEHSYEAVQAVSMFNDQVLCGRPIRVRMDRDPHSGNSSASFYAYRRDERRDNVGLPENGRLPTGLEDVGLTLKELSRSLTGSSYRSSRNVGGNGTSGGGGRDGVGSSRDGAGSRSHYSSSWRNHGSGQGPSPRFRSGGGSSGRGGGFSGDNYEDSSPGFKGGDSTRCVMIKNLPFDFSWRDLKRLMSEVGNVRFVDILLSSNQRSTGIGTVRFASCADAERAVRKLDGMRVEGRTVRVELDFQN